MKNVLYILLTALLLTSCKASLEDRQDTLRELFPEGVILSNPDLRTTMLVIDTTGTDLYYVAKYDLRYSISPDELILLNQYNYVGDGLAVKAVK